MNTTTIVALVALVVLVLLYVARRKARLSRDDSD
jgi:heme/copper-type cytochrome/quinol oxidase subunit 2